MDAVDLCDRSQAWIQEAIKVCLSVSQSPIIYGKPTNVSRVTQLVRMSLMEILLEVNRYMPSVLVNLILTVKQN